MQSQTILSEAEELRQTLVADRRRLHAFAETGFRLQQTKQYVKEQLINCGISPCECGKSGICALIGKGREGGVFLLRADMDALPVKEESGAEYAATNGNMHACGHDMHTAMLLGAARILKAHEKELCGRVKLMFQPAEEILEGARDMIEGGVLREPEVDGAMMIHVMTGVELPEGSAVVSAPGVGAPAADYFTIKVKGKGCHGAMPNTGVDPLNAAAHILLALQEINARELAISDRSALTVGSIKGGNAPNVIPDEVLLEGSVRSYDDKTHAYIKQRMQSISRHTAKAFRAEAEVTFGSGCPTLINDKALAENALRYCRELLGDRALGAAEMGGDMSKTAGSEDFAYVSHRVPSVMIALAAGAPSKGHGYPLHHPKVTFDESALPFGAAVYAYTALRRLQESN